MSLEQGWEILAAFMAVPLKAVSGKLLVPSAFQLAAATGLSVYEGVYLAQGVAAGVTG